VAGQHGSRESGSVSQTLSPKTPPMCRITVSSLPLCGSGGYEMSWPGGGRESAAAIFSGSVSSASSPSGLCPSASLEADIFFLRCRLVEDASDVGSPLSDESDKEYAHRRGALSFGLYCRRLVSLCPSFPPSFPLQTFLCYSPHQAPPIHPKTPAFVSGFRSTVCRLGLRTFSPVRTANKSGRHVIEAASAGIDVSDGSIATSQ
jgi:hypothetical protein